MLNLLVMRHGHAEKNLHKLFAPLSPQGHQQAQLAAQFCQHHWPHVDAVYSSDLTRAHQTAQYLASPPTIDPRLREYKTWGEDGRPLENDLRTAMPEHWEFFRERVLGFLDELAQRHQDGYIVLVTHGGVFDLLVSCALKFGGNAGIVSLTHHSALSHFYYTPQALLHSERVKLIFHNRTDHLPTDQLTG